MGLFDAYYDPSTYQGGGGLIDRLLAQLGPQAQYQPSPGLPPQSDPNAATPIGVGNYQMPRAGNADLYQPQVPTDVSAQSRAPNAQPTQGQLPAQTPQEQAAGLLPAPMRAAQLPPQLQAPGSGFGDHLLAGAQNFAHGGGLIPAVINGITGLATGQRTDPQGMQAATLRSEYEALIASGVPEAKARLAVINPEFAKTIIPEALGPDQFEVKQTGQDGLGRQTYQLFNKHTGELKPINSAATSGDAGLGDMNLTGKDYLASVPAAQRGTVQGVAEGAVPFPGAFALTRPYWQGIVQAVKQYDPSFDATNWGGRVAGVKDFSSGKSSEMVRSANQTIGHIGDLIDKMDALNNGQYPLKNQAGNYINNKLYGETGVTGFQQTAHAVADELSKVFKGAGISDHEIRQWEENLSPNMSPAQQREAVTTAMSLLQHSLSALEEKRLNSIGPVAAEKAGPLLKSDAQAAVDRIQKWAKAGSNTPAATTRTGVKWSVE